MAKTLGQYLDESGDDPVAAMVAAVDRANTLEAEVERLRSERDTALDEQYRLANNTGVAEAEVERLRAALAEVLNPNTEWTAATWERLLAVRDGDDHAPTTA